MCAVLRRRKQKSPSVYLCHDQHHEGSPPGEGVRAQPSACSIIVLLPKVPCREVASQQRPQQVCAELRVYYRRLVPAWTAEQTAG